MIENMCSNFNHTFDCILKVSIVNNMHSTNYYNTFIEIAEDCPVDRGEVPALRGEKKTIAGHQFDMLYDHPYQYTSDEVLFGVFAIRKEFEDHEIAEQRKHYFSKGQPCFRASPLTKRYGWGIHSDENGKIAMYSADSKEYTAFVNDPALKKVKAMKSRR